MILKCFTFTQNSAQQFSTWLIIINVSNHHIRMISEGSCDTEDWSNDAENSALHQRNKLHFKIYYKRTHLLNINISQQYCTVIFILYF